MFEWKVRCWQVGLSDKFKGNTLCLMGQFFFLSAQTSFLSEGLSGLIKHLRDEGLLLPHRFGSRVLSNKCEVFCHVYH